jgi:hypothetical protein
MAVFRKCGAAALLLGACLCAQDVGLAELKPHTLEAFNRYIRQTEARIEGEIRSDRFLWAEQSPERLRRVRGGEVVVAAWSGKGEMEIRDGLVQDWIGAAFIPGATLQKTLALLQNYDNHKNIYGPEVMDSKLISRSGNDYEIYFKLLKKKVITVVLNTRHDARYYPLSKTRVYSRSYSTRISELRDAGKPAERELPPGKDHGFLWRLDSYWRFEERDGGVYIECQAISLTRDIPTGLGWLITPIIRNLPRESLANTLAATQRAVR